MCSYEDANYTISILNDSGATVDELQGTPHENDDERELVDVDFTGNMLMNATYLVRVKFISVVNSTSTEFSFNTCKSEQCHEPRDSKQKLIWFVY